MKDAKEVGGKHSSMATLDFKPHPDCLWLSDVKTNHHEFTAIQYVHQASSDKLLERDLDILPNPYLGRLHFKTNLEKLKLSASVVISSKTGQGQSDSFLWIAQIPRHWVRGQIKRSECFVLLEIRWMEKWEWMCGNVWKSGEFGMWEFGNR